MNRTVLFALLAAATLFAAGSAQGEIVNDFTGAFAPANWTNWNDPGSIKDLTWPYGDTTLQVASNTSETTAGVSGGGRIVAPGTGTISFTHYTQATAAGAFDAYADPNTAAAPTHLNPGSGSTPAAGKVMNIVAGELIDFYAYSGYSGSELEGYGITYKMWIYDFVADYQAGVVVPEPGALSLLALGAAGVAGLRRRRS